MLEKDHLTWLKKHISLRNKSGAYLTWLYKEITSSIFYITMLGKGFPEHGYFETPVQ